MGQGQITLEMCFSRTHLTDLAGHWRKIPSARTKLKVKQLLATMLHNSAPTVVSFKSRLKTQLFSDAFC